MMTEAAGGKGEVSAIRVRPARPQDAPWIAPLLADIGFPTDDSMLAARLADGSRSTGLALVAAQNGKRVGIVTVQIYSVLHRQHPVGRITLLVVAEEAQGRGIGRALVLEAERECASQGCEVVEVISNRRYSSAHGFYERLGYSLTSVKFKKTL